MDILDTNNFSLHMHTHKQSNEFRKTGNTNFPRNIPRIDERFTYR